jgi:hypothetical protein
MQKVDHKKELKHLYNPPTKEVVEVVVPAMNYLMVDGEGDPNTAPAYAAALEALYALSYTLKFMVKKGAAGIDYTVMPLEGLWWAEDMATFSVEKKGDWLWTMMIMQPPQVTPELVSRAVDDVRQKKNPAALSLVRFESYNEGLCAQTMHTGPFSAEGPTIQRVHDFIEKSGRTLSGKHHEIYLSDIRKADPAKWKTVIRQPMQ